MSDSVCTVEVCDRPADGGFVCRSCTNTLDQVLGETPFLVEELTLVMTRQVRYTSGGGGDRTKGREKPLPLNLNAVEVLSDLHGLLVSWCRMFAEETGAPLPANTPLDASLWLQRRLDMVRNHEAGGDLVSEACAMRAKAMWTIDRPAERQFLGNCDEQNHAPNVTSGDLSGEQPVVGSECPGEVYGRSGSHEARCDTCGATWPAEDLKAYLLGQMDDKILSAAEIARIGTFLGLDLTRDQLRKRINQWHKRGRIQRKAGDEDDPRFLFADVKVLLEAHNTARFAA